MRGGFGTIARAWAATTALFLAGFLVPFCGPFFAMVSPQPGLRVDSGDVPRPLVVMVLLVAAATGIIAGLPVAIFYGVSFGLLTIALPMVLRREWSIEVTIGLATALIALATITAALFAVTPSELFAALRTALDQVREDALRLYQRAGIAADVVQEIEAGSSLVIDWILRLSPALFIVSIAAVVLLNIALLRRSQRARGLLPVFGDLTRWKSPPELVWLLIGSGYATLMIDGVAQIVAANVFAVMLVVYFCHGLVIAQFYMRRWRSPIWVVGLVYVFILVEWLVATGVMLLGVFDLWVDFRRLNPRPAEED